MWGNRAEKEWTLTPNEENNELLTGDTCPYKDGYNNATYHCTVVRGNGQVKGIDFGENDLPDDYKHFTLYAKQ